MSTPRFQEIPSVPIETHPRVPFLCEKQSQGHWTCSQLEAQRGQGTRPSLGCLFSIPVPHLLPPPPHTHTHTEIHTLPSLLCPVPRGVTPADPSPAPCPLASDWAQFMGGTGSGQEGGWAERSHHDIHPLSLPEGDLP